MLFQVVHFLENLSTKAIQKALQSYQINIYLGPPNYIVHNIGTNFVLKEFRANTRILAIKVYKVLIKVYNSVGKVKRYYISLQQVYKILKQEIIDINKKTILQIAIKAINNSIGPNSLVLTLFVFRAYLQIIDKSLSLLLLYTYNQAIQKVIQELQQLQAKQQVIDTLSI